MLPSRPRNITLFPYTTLFRSHEHVGLARREHAARRARAPGASLGRPAEPGPARQGHPASRAIPATGGGRAARTGGDPLGTSYTDLSRPFGTIAEDPVMVVAQAGVAPGAARVTRLAFGGVPGRGPGARPQGGASRAGRAGAGARD